MLSYEANIIRALSKFGSGDTKNPDTKSNVGNMLGEYFLWKTIAKYAEGRVESSYKEMEKAGAIKVPDAPGNYELLSSNHFKLMATVTQPVKRFSPDELAKLMGASKYKVPEPFMKEQMEKAKVPGSSMVRKEIKETP